MVRSAVEARRIPRPKRPPGCLLKALGHDAQPGEGGIHAENNIFVVLRGEFRQN
jgi:hypothetical protein